MRKLNPLSKHSPHGPTSCARTEPAVCLRCAPDADARPVARRRHPSRASPCMAVRRRCRCRTSTRPAHRGVGEQPASTGAAFACISPVTNVRLCAHTLRRRTQTALFSSHCAQSAPASEPASQPASRTTKLTEPTEPTKPTTSGPARRATGAAHAEIWHTQWPSTKRRRNQHPIIFGPFGPID